MKDLDKFRGCLIGGAVGDALGYPVEFLDDASIFKKYGKKGITEYDCREDGIAEISDDTQMTLFTANGLLLGTTRGMTHGIMGKYSGYVAFCYKDWLRTMVEDYPIDKEATTYAWLSNIPELFSSREPGRTCINYLMHNNLGTPEEPKNNSKGCGGVMRVAPVGLYFDYDKYSEKDIDMVGAEVSALTHGHELGYIPSAALVHIIRKIAYNPEITLKEAVLDSIRIIPSLFPNAVYIDELVALLHKAIELSEKVIDDLEAIRELGEGWVAEETLAIAVYCSLKYSNDFEKAIVASVNHSGDSDSTGAVTGNIMGAYLGITAIPEKFIFNLELKDLIVEMADDLFHDCQWTEYSHRTDSMVHRDEIWKSKYLERTYSSSDHSDGQRYSAEHHNWVNI